MGPPALVLPSKQAHSDPMDRTMNLAIVAVVVAGAFAVTLAFLVW